MKTITLSTLLLAFSFIGFSQNNPLVGKWGNLNKTNGEEEKFEFKGDNTAIMYQDGEDSPPFEYTLDTSKSPNWVNLTMDNGDFKIKIMGHIKVMALCRIWWVLKKILSFGYG